MRTPSDGQIKPLSARKVTPPLTCESLPFPIKCLLGNENQGSLRLRLSILKQRWSIISTRYSEWFKQRYKCSRRHPRYNAHEWNRWERLQGNRVGRPRR